jgi:hypothetical protein
MKFLELVKSLLAVCSVNLCVSERFVVLMFMVRFYLSRVIVFYCWFCIYYIFQIIWKVYQSFFVI